MSASTPIRIFHVAQFMDILRNTPNGTYKNTYMTPTLTYIAVSYRHAILPPKTASLTGLLAALLISVIDPPPIHYGSTSSGQ